MIKIFKKDIKNSFKQFKFKLIVPDLIFIIITIFLMNLFASYNGILSVSQSELQSIVIANFGQVLGSLIVFALAAFFIGARLKSFKLTMILDAINNKNLNLIKSYKDSKKFYWKVVLLKVLAFLVFLLTFTLSLIIYSLLESNYLRLATILPIIIFAVIALTIFYREAILFIDKKSSTKSLISAFKFFKKSKVKVLLAALLIAAINFIIFYSIAIIPVSENLILGNIISATTSLILFSVAAWTQLFIFNTYKTIKKN
ncbi:hypothetical protein HN992_01025 [Candidatus Woesearchaeota archaeon]|nr:hypothetical protein [Candidatus Woesearchaeota archaeon]MBT3438773.1 hypothetical protein [Candidatus Woesearchaeota archaeon]MBT4208740.1 hypothetical protein [Candidatus Woesearchaeota archaeon]MBT4733171.1 hypothetical protein [Candidatus Woesearchaeota archaeon]MBT4783170.1 hypothetical protein [Candidatus Woesearchaeota archaeon]